MKMISFILRYLRHWLKADGESKIHSPFVFNLFTNIIKDNNPFYIYKDIETIRLQLLHSKKIIFAEDFGTGRMKGNIRVKQIAGQSSKKPAMGQLLFRLVNHFKPKIILELGTSFGISTLYLAYPNRKSSKVITIEGCPETAAIALKNFERLHINNVRLITGNFDNVLPQALAETPQLDCVFFDGNHRKEPTLSYFEQCLPLAHNESFFIFDDIHWSDEMEQAWSKIKDNPKVTLTIDLFFLGLVFFRQEQTKQHFTLRWNYRLMRLFVN